MEHKNCGKLLRSVQRYKKLFMTLTVSVNTASVLWPARIMEEYVSTEHYFKFPIEGLCEKNEHLDIFLLSAHHSVVFYFQCSVYWWKGSVSF